jgi:hypothetical protein
MRLDADFGRDVLIAILTGIAIKWVLVAFVFGSGGIEHARWLAAPGVGVAIGAVVLGVLRGRRRARRIGAGREGDHG